MIKYILFLNILFNIILLPYAQNILFDNFKIGRFLKNLKYSISTKQKFFLRFILETKGFFLVKIA
jgi:hypothetical protein